ncbi:MAG TPA: signal peptidase I [Eubacteriales bacterium]|mgnify:CR=1 FL=1|nr:signal peptidase I [Clostridia bacterium]HRV73928.1 signal peptidase I [Eubacteriales bacterium]
MTYKDLDKKEFKAIRHKLDKRNEHLEGGARWRNLDLFICIVAVLVFAFAIREVVAEPVKVKGSSMESTLLGGDYMLVEKLSYTVSTPDRGDIVICYYPDEYYEKYHSYEEKNSCVKRVIGCPGDVVAIGGGKVSVNGVALDEYYLDEDALTFASQGEFVVPQGYVMVMGDNRSVSSDSRSADVGFIPLERVLGRARMVILPIIRAKMLHGVDYGV